MPVELNSVYPVNLAVDSIGAKNDPRTILNFHPNNPDRNKWLNQQIDNLIR